MLTTQRMESLRNAWAEKKGLATEEYMDFIEYILNAENDFRREIAPQYKYVPEEKVFAWLDKEYEGYLANKDFYKDEEEDED